jgi:uncharacterized protein DUF5989
MNLWQKFIRRSSVLKDLFRFLWINRLWWMVPIVLVFLLLGILIWLTQSSAVASFIYTLF